MYFVRLLLRPLGYLAFTAAVAALSTAAWLLGSTHELGFFVGRLARMIQSYPEITRRGVQIAWGVWFALLLYVMGPWSPTGLAVWDFRDEPHWDELVVVAIGALLLLRRLSRRRQLRGSARRSTAPD
jgi:hypothetical protein